MPIQRLNHAVLYIRDLERTRAFYTEALDFTVVHEVPGFGLFFQAPGSTNDHDLGTFVVGGDAGPSQAGKSTVGLYHLAWEVDTLAELERLGGVLSERGALVGASSHGSTKSLYAHDPDGHELEVCWLVPLDRLDELAEQRVMAEPLDVAAEIERYGADTLGGVGVSRPGVRT
jgi:catechol 2,3-dioxygenase-like lactoylglutathione lyase family enzyme